MSFKFGFHQWQGLSLLIAVGFLWFPHLDHMLSMGLASGIIVVNAVIEIRG